MPEGRGDQVFVGVRDRVVDRQPPLPRQRPGSAYICQTRRSKYASGCCWGQLHWSIPRSGWRWNSPNAPEDSATMPVAASASWWDCASRRRSDRYFRRPVAPVRRRIAKSARPFPGSQGVSRPRGHWVRMHHCPVLPAR